MGLTPYLGLRGNALLRAAVALVVFPTFTCYGYNMSVAGGLLTLPAFNEQFPRMDTMNTEGDLKADNSMIQGTVIALYTVGGIFGALSCAHLGDRLGRKKVIFWANFVCMIGCILMATSFNFAQFIVARIFLGTLICNCPPRPLAKNVSSPAKGLPVTWVDFKLPAFWACGSQPYYMRLSDARLRDASRFWLTPCPCQAHQNDDQASA